MFGTDAVLFTVNPKINRSKPGGFAKTNFAQVFEFSSLSVDFVIPVFPATSGPGCFVLRADRSFV